MDCDKVPTPLNNKNWEPFMQEEITIPQALDGHYPSGSKLGKPFWVVWAIELWERFGFYGTQAILALYFVKQLGYSEALSISVFGSFSAFVYGFVWIGGYIGDSYLGSKRTMIVGAIILMLSYVWLALSDQHTVFYALATIVVGNTLFKANSSSLIAKMYRKGDPAFDGAMTMYYMAVNVGSLISMFLTPIIADTIGWAYAYWLCAFGLLLGVANCFIFSKILEKVSLGVDKEPLKMSRLSLVLALSAASIAVIAWLLPQINLCNIIVYTVVTAVFLYFLKLAFDRQGVERTRMFVALVLIIQAVIFFVLYNQMPTSLTFYAVHNVNNNFMNLYIPPAEYQLLNPLVIVIMSPILVWFYHKVPSTHVTKFCIGMSLCAVAFFVLFLAKFFAVDGLVSPWWMVLTYYFQSVGELLISGLGLAMVAELCPSSMAGFVMGIWFLTSMLSGPLGAWVGNLTEPEGGLDKLTAVQTLGIYSHVFLEISIITGLVAILMWMMRSRLNRYIN
jgi:POT family proton-dependent oligopeptide transporter